VKIEPQFQNQHRIPQVYLKQFGYSKDKEHWVSVLEIGTKLTENKLIVEFTAETNIFDLPVDDDEIKRHFENLSGYVENFYRTVISNLINQKKLTDKNKDVLNHFVANILCRTHTFRNLISDLLNDPVTRDDLIDEVTMFSGDGDSNRKVLEHFEKDFELNIFIGTVMNHLVSVFRKFNKVVIRDYQNHGWITTDNPVFIDRQENFRWLVPIEAEIYFPLSKDFCLFMFHPDSDKNANPLRSRRIEKVNTVNFETFDRISMQLGRNFYKYLILCGETSPTIIE